MTDTIFPDISEFQPHADFAALRGFGVQAIAVRVAYGSRLDKCVPERVALVRQSGFTAIIWYHFLRDQPAEQQVATFTSAVPSLGPGEGVFVDWESDLNGKIPSAELRDEVCRLFDRHYGRSTGIYASASTAPATDRHLWVAAYGVKTEPDKGQLLWQYTDGRYTSAGHDPVNYPSLGRCDSNIFHGTPGELAHALEGNQVAPIYVPQEDDDMPQPTDVIKRIEWPARIENGRERGEAEWVFQRDGGVFAYGDTEFFGSIPALPENERKSWTELGTAFANDPEDRGQGWIIYNRAPADPYKFDPAKRDALHAAGRI